MFTSPLADALDCKSDGKPWKNKPNQAMRIKEKCWPTETQSLNPEISRFRSWKDTMKESNESHGKKQWNEQVTGNENEYGSFPYLP